MILSNLINNLLLKILEDNIIEGLTYYILLLINFMFDFKVKF